MEKKIILYVIALIILCFSCAKDHGNYDYKDINAIQVKGLPDVWDYENFKYVYVGERLQMNPELVFSNQEDTTGLSYIWTLDFDTVAHTRNLDIIVNRQPIKPAWGCYRVRDNKTDVEYIFQFYLEIRASYENGWMFLCEKPNGRGQFNFFRPGNKEEGREDLLLTDAYFKLNGEELSAEPIDIRHNFINSYQDRYNQVNIICKGAPNQSVDIDGVTFKKIINNKEEFVGGSTPQDFAPTATFHSDYGYGILSNKKLYTREGAEFQEGLFINFPARPESPLKENYELAPILMPLFTRNANYALTFDQKNSTYLLTNGVKLIGLPVGTDTAKIFNPYEMDGKQLLTMGRIREEYENTGGKILAILQDKNGNFIEQRFQVTAPDYGGGLTTEIEQPFGGAAYFSETSLLACSFNTSYIYFTSGDGHHLYAYNFETGNVQEITLPFTGAITAMTIENDDKSLIVGVNNNGVGDIYWLSVELGQEGTVKREILGKMGKPVAIRYKVDSWY